ncbi:MAG: hypothetical protein ACYCZF_10690 [Anaerolineae bacterium]
MSTRFLVSGGIALAIIIAGAVLQSGLLILSGVLGELTILRFARMDRWKDNEQIEMYIPTYKKEWEDKKKR